MVTAALLILTAITLLVTLGQYFWVHHYVMNVGPPRTLQVAKVAANEAVQDVREGVEQLLGQAPKMLASGVDPRDAVEARELKKADRRIASAGGAYGLLVDKLGPDWGKWAWENAIPEDIREDLAKGSLATVIKVLGPIVDRVKAHADKATTNADTPKGGW